MVCPNDVQVRQRLEGLYQQSPNIPVQLQLWRFLQQVGAAVVQELTRDRNEPRISKYYDVEGQARWHVYDPHSGQRFTYLSEDEVRVWLDDRYSS